MEGQIHLSDSPEDRKPQALPLESTTKTTVQKQKSSLQAASIVQASDHDSKQAVFISESLSVLQAYQNHKLPNLARAMQFVAARKAVLQWIPALCGTAGNGQASIFAKEGARGEEHNKNVSFSEKKTLIRALTMPRSQRNDFHLHSREQQVVVSSSTKMSSSSSFKKRCVAGQHYTDNQTLQLQAGAGQDDFIYLPSSSDRAACERQEEEEKEYCFTQSLVRS